MLISEESILNQLPQDMFNEREFIFIEAIVSTIKTIDISYCRLIECLNSKTVSADEFLMIEVWNIIDSSHRLRCLLDKTPSIKKNEPCFQLTIRKLKTVEPIRHFIQHYDREINNLISNVMPLMGHLSFVVAKNRKEYQVISIVPGYVRKYKGLEMVNPLGHQIVSEIDLIEFYINHLRVSLSDIYHQLGKFVIDFEDKINQ